MLFGLVCTADKRARGSGVYEEISQQLAACRDFVVECGLDAMALAERQCVDELLGIGLSISCLRPSQGSDLRFGLLGSGAAGKLGFKQKLWRWWRESGAQSQQDSDIVLSVRLCMLKSG